MPTTDTITFTPEWVQSLPVPVTGRSYYKDTDLSDLALYTTSKGAKTFFIRKRVKGRDERIIIGSAKIFSIEKARTKAREIAEQIAEGLDPVAEKRKQLFNQITLRIHCRDYIDMYSKKHKKTWAHDQRDMDRFFSQWYDRRLGDVSRFEVQKLYYKIAEENGPYQATRTIERLKTIYNKAIEWGWQGDNPARKIKTFREKSRERFIQPEEMPFLIQSLNDEPSETARDYFWMLLLTGARKTNMLTMRWDQINWQRQTWRIPDTKNGDSVLLPLLGRAVAILKKRQKVSTTEWVFPSTRNDEKHFINAKRAWRRIIRRATIYQWRADEALRPIVDACETMLAKETYLGYWMHLIKERAAQEELVLPVGLMDTRLHDIRRTFGSYQAINGSNLLVIGRSLGHKCQKSTLVYARLSLDPVLASIKQATEAMFSACNLTEPDND